MKIRRHLGALGAALLVLSLSSTAHSAPVIFSGSFDGFTLGGGGYGEDNPVEVRPVGFGLPGEGITLLPGGQGGTLLDVLFPAGGLFASTPPPGLSAGSAVNFNIGDITLRERFIDAAELDGLEITANFTLVLPAGVGTFQMSGVATAIAGPVPNYGDPPGSPTPTEPDDTIDFTIAWTPLDVPFGAGGLFRMELATLNFSGPNGFVNADQFQTLAQTGTLTLLTEPRTVRVPAPATLALMGLGLAGLGFSRRRRAS